MKSPKRKALEFSKNSKKIHEIKQDKRRVGRRIRELVVEMFNMGLVGLWLWENAV